MFNPAQALNGIATSGAVTAVPGFSVSTETIIWESEKSGVLSSEERSVLAVLIPVTPAQHYAFQTLASALQKRGLAMAQHQKAVKDREPVKKTGLDAAVGVFTNLLKTEHEVAEAEVSVAAALIYGAVTGLREELLSHLGLHAALYRADLLFDRQEGTPRLKRYRSGEAVPLPGTV